MEAKLLIRAIHPDDKQRLLNGSHRLIGKSIYFRFFSAIKDLTEKELKHFTEIAFAVDNEHQNLGVGTILFKYLVTFEQHNGIAKLEADVLMDNRNMLEIFKHSGLTLDTLTNSAVTHIEFDIAGKELNKYYIKEK